MAGLLMLARREVVERRNVLIAALLLGAGALVGPWLWSQGPAADARSVLLVIALCGLLPAGALMLGSTVIASDLAEGRIGFYFRRPLSGGAIYLGKVMGGLALLAAAAVLVSLPALVAGTRIGSALLADWDLPLLVGLFAAGVLFLFFLGHAATIALRSHSRWLLVDVVALAGLVLLAGRALASLRQVQAGWPVTHGAGAAALGVTLALIGAGAAAVIGGRADIRRAHRILSLSLWSGAGLVVLAFSLLAAWVVAATPADLVAVGKALPSPRGPWIAVAGEARGHQPFFLVDLQRPQRWFRLPPFAQRAFSASGRVAWIDDDGWRIVTIAGEDAGPPRRTRIAASSRWDQLFLSPDGGRLAILSAEHLELFDLAAERLLMAAPLPRPCRSGSRGFVHFAASGRVRLFRSLDCDVRAPGSVTGFELDPEGEKLVELTRVEGWLRRVSADGERLRMERGGNREVWVDAVSGAEVEAPAGELPALHDGRRLLTELRDGQATLLVSSAAGATERTIPLGAAGGARIEAEIAPGRVLVQLSWPAGGRPPSVLVIDVDGGAAYPLPADLRPEIYLAAEESVPWVPGRLHGRLFLDRELQVVLLDPETLALTPLPALFRR